MSFFQKRYLGLPLLAIILGLVAGGVALAATAMSINHQGSVTVVSPPPPAPTYTFKVYDAQSGGAEIPDGNTAYFALGQVQTGAVVNKLVYVEKTGTGNMTVTPSASWTGTAPGTITFTPASVPLTDSLRQAIQVTFTAGSTPAASTNFQITYAGSY